MSTLKKKQHYVWQRYLKPWTIDGKICCLRQKDNVLFCASTAAVANETFFYRISRLTIEDKKYIDLLIDKNSSNLMRDHHRSTLHMFQLPFTIRDLLKDSKLPRQARARLNLDLEVSEKTIGEHWHESIEDRAAPLMEELKQSRCSFFDNQTDALKFCHYIGHQFFRTPKLREINSKLENPFPNLDLKRTWFIESNIYADNISSSIFVEREAYKFEFLENHSGTDFITTDQPIINLNNHTDQELRLFYPITPKLAIIFFKDENAEQGSVTIISAVQAEYYNQMLFNRSFDQIYSTTKNQLLKFRPDQKSIQGNIVEK